MSRRFVPLVFTLLLWGSQVVHGQTQRNSVFTLDNGATVWYQTYSQINLKDDKRNFGSTEKSGNSVRRTMQDETGRPWLGFELHIDRVPGAGPIRFNLSMEPLGGWSFFGQKPIPREIQNGDRILLDVIEEPGSGRKIFDTFSVGIGVVMQIMPMTRTIPEMADSGTLIHLQSPRFTKIGRSSTALGESASSIVGVAVAVSSTAEGRFSFSARPEPGFRMEAIAEGNRLSFVAGSDAYVIECASSVVDSSVARYLWVRRDSDSDARVSPTLDLSVK